MKKHEVLLPGTNVPSALQSSSQLCSWFISALLGIEWAGTAQEGAGSDEKGGNPWRLLSRGAPGSIWLFARATLAGVLRMTGV